jgi:hypothetical protein
VKSLLRRRPTPALVIALLALFVSLSGVSYGVATGFIDSREIKNNEIRSLDIRDNQVRSRDIRNNEVRGIDIRNSTVQSRDIAINAVRGEDVKEDTLAKVPSALLADSATTAGTAGTAASVASLKLIGRTTVAEGAAPVTLATHGPLTVSADCNPNGADTDAVVLLASAENDAAGGNNPPVPDLDTSDASTPIATLTDLGGGDRTVEVQQVFGLAPSGKGFTGQIAMIADAFGAGSCVFQGHLALQG